jgi:dimethylargininase
MNWLALTRAVSPTLGDCELTHVDRTAIDVSRATQQHAAYEDALRALGCQVERVSPAPQHPDAVFIEDTAVVLDELAILTRPGAESRRGELAAVREALARYRPVRELTSPATLDGGDVLVVGRTIHVGRTARTNEEGIAQLRRLVTPHAYRVVPVDVHGCLHLKSAVTALDDETVLANDQWVDVHALAPLVVVPVSADEPGAANVMRLDDRLLVAEAYPRTNAALRARGHQVVTVAADELAKAEGALTCGSLLLKRP